MRAVFDNILSLLYSVKTIKFYALGQKHFKVYVLGQNQKLLAAHRKSTALNILRKRTHRKIVTWLKQLPSSPENCVQ